MSDLCVINPPHGCISLTFVALVNPARILSTPSLDVSKTYTHSSVTTDSIYPRCLALAVPTATPASPGTSSSPEINPHRDRRRTAPSP
jgi:hypothetical protein